MPNIEFDIKKIADLSLLDLTDEEIDELSVQLPNIVAYVSKLHEVDTSEIEGKEYLTNQENVFRDDKVIIDEKERSRVIDAFPIKKGNLLEVPGVFE